MHVLLTLGARTKLAKVLANERRENPEAVFRIWETRRGRYNEAKICLALTLDEAEEDDERVFCCNLPFVASHDFLSMRGEPHIFCIFTNHDGVPEVEEFGK